MDAAPHLGPIERRTALFQVLFWRGFSGRIPTRMPNAELWAVSEACLDVVEQTCRICLYEAPAPEGPGLRRLYCHFVKGNWQPVVSFAKQPVCLLEALHERLVTWHCIVVNGNVHVVVVDDIERDVVHLDLADS